MIYIVFLAGVYIFSVLYNEKITFILFLMVAFVPFLMKFLCLFVRSRIHVTLTTSSQMIRKQEEGTLVIQIENKSLLPVANVEIPLKYYNLMQEEVHTESFFVSLLSNSVQKIIVTVDTAYVGLLSFEVDTIVLKDYIHITKAKKRVYEKIAIFVLPSSQVECHENIIVQNDMVSEHYNINEKKKGDDPSEIFEIREYREGDKLKSVHWKLSNKHQRLMVKEFSQEFYYTPLILLDLYWESKSDNEGGKPRGLKLKKVDGIIECFASFAQWHMQSGYEFDVMYAVGVEESKLMTVKSMEDIYLLLEEVYQVGAKQKKISFMEQIYYEKLEFNYSNIIAFSCNYFSHEERKMATMMSPSIYHVYVCDKNEYEYQEEMQKQIYEQSNLLYTIVEISKLEEGIYHMMERYRRSET